MEIILFFLLWFLAIYLAKEIGKSKNRNGFWWGFLLGWLGVLVIALLPPKL